MSPQVWPELGLQLHHGPGETDHPQAGQEDLRRRQEGLRSRRPSEEDLGPLTAQILLLLDTVPEKAVTNEHWLLSPPTDQSSSNLVTSHNPLVRQCPSQLYSASNTQEYSFLLCYPV